MENSELYQRAKKRIKRIKGFYIHATVFVLVNLLLLVLKYLKHDDAGWSSFFGMGLWGIGLLCHGVSVFLPGLFLGRAWEEKKIRELMSKNK